MVDQYASATNGPHQSGQGAFPNPTEQPAINVRSVEFSDDQQIAFVTIAWGPSSSTDAGRDHVRVAIPLEIVQAIGSAAGNRPDVA